MSDEEFDFDEQIRLEEEEKQKAALGKVRVDEDGTQYEWDEDKKAWFPKIDANFIAQYQMNYGNFEGEQKTSETSSKAESTQEVASHLPPAPPIDDPAYYYWYYHLYLPSQGQAPGSSTDNPEKPDKDTRGEKIYEKKADSTKTKKGAGSNTENEKCDNSESENPEENVNLTETDESEKSKENEDSSKSEEYQGTDKEAYEEYYKKYCEWYYEQHRSEGSQDGRDNTDAQDYWNQYYQYYQQHPQDQPKQSENSQKTDTPDNKDGQPKKGKKHKLQQKDQGWFEMDQNRNTSVYVSSLPSDITDDEYKELMAKCGLIAMDPVKHSLKLKLYRDREGNVKGDGLCSYIKMESVELALEILDGYRLRDKTISVEPAKFELKGAYDPTKKKKKLSNKEKRKLKEKQEKLFDWKLDKGRGVRSNFEKTLVFKNIFDPTDFERDPTLLFKLRDKLKEECGKYGEVRKVLIHDRHPDKVATAIFKEVEEADMCKQYMDNRFFNQRTIAVETWDGKTKYSIQESEEEEQKRLQSWDSFLKDGTQPAGQGQIAGPAGPVPSVVDNSTAKTDAMDESSALDSTSSKETGGDAISNTADDTASAPHTVKVTSDTDTSPETQAAQDSASKPALLADVPTVSESPTSQPAASQNTLEMSTSLHSSADNV